jgi:glycosyltransferase involved in cell wall biosynthesis
MASGCPVISSTRGSLDEVVSEAALRIDPENIEEMAAALTTLATDDNARKDLIRRGFVNAKRFDWQKNGHNYLDICRLLINKYKN